MFTSYSLGPQDVARLRVRFRGLAPDLTRHSKWHIIPDNSSAVLREQQLRRDLTPAHYLW